MYSKSEFAKDTLNHLQSLINLTDVKTGLLLTVTAIITASFFAILGSLEYKSCSTIIFIFTTAFIVCFLTTTITLLNVIRARYGQSGVDNPKGLIFFGDILKYQNGSDYKLKLDGASDDDLLTDLSNNIYGLAKVLEMKLKNLKEGILALKVMLVIWAIAVVVFLLIQ